jgi:hypothetical protein
MIKFIKRKIVEKKFENNKKEKQKSSRLFYVLSGFLFVVALALFLILILKEKAIINNTFSNEENIEIQENIICDNCQRRLLDGKLINEGDVNSFIVATIIDNHPDARPAIGLSQAEIVYDVPAEGGINRYLAFFNIEDKNNLQIGPIRSARPYFLDIAREYQAMLIHCGGSPEALARISKEKILALNEFYNGAYFERNDNYLAPHNVVANFDDIKEYLKERNYTKSDFSSWSFKDKEVISDLDLFLASLDINISNGQKQYEVDWSYDVEQNIYLRSLAGKKQTDDSGNQIKAENLIFQFVETEILDSALRLKIDLSSGGMAVVCLDGICKEAYWEKDENNRTKYYFKNEEEIIFNAGQTWIHFIDENTKVDY